MNIEIVYTSCVEIWSTKFMSVNEMFRQLADDQSTNKIKNKTSKTVINQGMLYYEKRVN